MPYPNDDFVRLLTSVQDRLYAYIRTMAPSADAAREILQETNVVLLRKAEELEDGQSFDAWACQVAYYEVLSYRRDRARDRHIFGEELLERIAATAQGQVQHANTRMAALENCLDRLSDAQRTLITTRYSQGLKVKEIAAAGNQPTKTIATKLYRIRQTLLDCVERLQSGEDPK